MWSLISKLTPLLLASTSTKPNWQTPTDLSQSLRQIYCDLEQPGPISHHMTPTLRFSYVPPPLHGTHTWKTVGQDGVLDKALQPDPTKPLAIYLPGVDGYGISASHNQFDDLANAFEFWRLTILPEDMSGFVTVVDEIANFIEPLAQDRQVVLIGESCGGLLASAVALRLRRTNSLKGLVLVNPATSFDQTAWGTLIPVVTSLQHLDNRNENNRDQGLSPYSVIGGLMLASLAPDTDQHRRIIDIILNLPGLDIPVSNPEQVQNMLDAMTDALRGTEERLPPQVLEHRVIKWLLAGNSAVSSRLSQIKIPTLVVVGQEDRLMPSAQEADRLVNVMPNAEKLVVPGRGHIVLDENVNLTEAIMYSDIDPFDRKKTGKGYDSILDWKRPSNKQLESAIKDTVQPLRTVHSPVFMSTDESGKRWMGLSKIPRPKGPLLFVGNHQFAATDVRLIMGELWEQRKMFPRGLAHPVTFVGSRQNELGGRTPGLTNPDRGNPFNGDFEMYGCVMVTPRNYYRLLQSGQDAMLFPGGAKEALSGRQDYPLFWPDNDFVRTAAKFNATIIPFSAVGMVDSVNVLLEVEEVFELPLIGERVRASSDNVTAARYDQVSGDEAMGMPLFVPTVPCRNYFLFGKPINLEDIDPKDKEACTKAFQQAQSTVRQGLDDILAAREHDPFKSTPGRIAFEQLFGKKAPTFSIDELNNRK